MLPLLIASLLADVCDQSGVHVEFGSVERDLPEAYYDSGQDSGSHYIIFTGSFVPHTSGTYTFTVNCTTYFTSQLMPAVAHLEWDELPVKSGRDVWSWTTDLRQDFRYSYKCTTDDNFYYATLELSVTIPSGAKFRVNTDYSDTCTVIGCKNISYSRTNNCEAPGAAVRPSEPSERAGAPPQTPGVGAGCAAGIAIGVVAVASIAAAIVVRRRKGAPPPEVAEALLGTEQTNKP
jgi:hypothetical protein